MPRLLGGAEAAPAEIDAAPMQPTAPPARPGDAALAAPLRLPGPWRHSDPNPAGGLCLGPVEAGGGPWRAARMLARSASGGGDANPSCPGGGAETLDLGGEGASAAGCVGGGGEHGGVWAPGFETAAALAAAAAAKARGRLHLAAFHAQRARRALRRGASDGEADVVFYARVRRCQTLCCAFCGMPFLQQ